jgi:hypothetical protein
MSFMIAAVYLRTKSLLLAMDHAFSTACFRCRPISSPACRRGASSAPVEWGGLSLLALFAALTVPALLAVEREEGPFSRRRGRKLDRVGAGD